MATNNDTWIVDDLKFILKINGEIIELGAINQLTKEAWNTGEINDKSASTIVEGLLDDPLSTLGGMIKDAFNKTNGVNYSLSFKAEVMEMTLSIAFYKQTRKFFILLNKKPTDAIWRLEQMIDDLRGQLAVAINSPHTLRSFHLDIISNLTTTMEIAKIEKLPVGKWLVELSFSVSFGNWAGGQGWIYYGVISDQTALSKGGNYISAGQQNGASYPVPIFERYVLEAPGDKPLFVRITPYSATQPSFQNIVLTATKI